jgi:hypothetical protein
VANNALRKFRCASFAILFALTFPLSYADAYFLSDQMVEWCTGDVQKQNFCHGFLLGVYENSTCSTSKKTPDWIELKKVFVGWVYAKGEDAYISASECAAYAFYEKYGCESFLQKIIESTKLTPKAQLIPNVNNQH